MPKKSAEALIAGVREIALALPDVEERLSHGEPSFFVRGRLFVTIDNNHHGSGHVAVWCNAAEGAQDVFVGSGPDHFFVPPYVGSKGWLGIRLDRGIDRRLLGDLLRQAHAESAARAPRGRAAKR